MLNTFCYKELFCVSFIDKLFHNSSQKRQNSLANCYNDPMLINQEIILQVKLFPLCLLLFQLHLHLGMGERRMLPALALQWLFWLNSLHLSVSMSLAVKWRYTVETYSRTAHLWDVWDQVQGLFCPVSALENDREDAPGEAEQARRDITFEPSCSLSRLDGFAGAIGNVFHEGAEFWAPKQAWLSRSPWEAPQPGFQVRETELGILPTHLRGGLCHRLYYRNKSTSFSLNS